MILDDEIQRVFPPPTFSTFFVCHFTTLAKDSRHTGSLLFFLANVVAKITIWEARF